MLASLAFIESAAAELGRYTTHPLSYQMNALAAYELLVLQMRGRPVVRTRIVLLTLQIYFAATDNDARAFELWCEPSWHLLGSTGIITGSGAIEGPDTYAEDEEVARANPTIAAASAASKILIGQTLERLVLDERTHALRAEFSGDFRLATFLNSPDTDALWVLRDPNQDLAVRATSRGLARGSRAGVV
ncbi:MAG: hypothetical protein H7Z40_06280 [Phycisphaerae bacterium]|nr:hypothetical protein [Gemmatimonadaceae bacterium]